MRKNTIRIVRAGLIAGIYVLLSMLTFPVASGAIQFRASEALTIFPLLFIESVPALAIGCMLSNFITGCTIIDIFFGSLVTLIAGFLTYIFGKLIKNSVLKVTVGGVFPVLLNAFLLPLIWIWCYGAIEYVYILQVVFLLITQSVSVYALGIPAYFSVKKIKDKGLMFLQ